MQAETEKPESECRKAMFSPNSHGDQIRSVIHQGLAQCWAHARGVQQILVELSGTKVNYSATALHQEGESLTDLFSVDRPDIWWCSRVFTFFQPSMLPEFCLYSFILPFFLFLTLLFYCCVCVCLFLFLFFWRKHTSTYKISASTIQDWTVALSLVYDTCQRTAWYHATGTHSERF